MDNNLKKFSLIICSLVLFFNQAIANNPIEHIPINKIDMNIAKNLYQKGQYKKSFLILKSLAKQGYALAQYSIGYMYLNGEGVTKNKEKAQFWIYQAAQQGLKKAILAKKILIAKYKKEKRNNLLAYNTKNDATILTYNDKKITPIEINKNKRKIIIDLHNKAFGAYDENGKLVRWGPISAGKDCGEFPDSCSAPKGKFKIFRKENGRYTSKKYPEPFGGAPMPYAMFFSGGVALHGSSLPGRHASHGCVRLLNEDAKWLNLEFSDINTRVIVQ